MRLSDEQKTALRWIADGDTMVPQIDRKIGKSLERRGLIAIVERDWKAFYALTEAGGIALKASRTAGETKR